MIYQKTISETISESSCNIYYSTMLDVQWRQRNVSVSSSTSKHTNSPIANSREPSISTNSTAACKIGFRGGFLAVGWCSFAGGVHNTRADRAPLPGNPPAMAAQKLRSNTEPVACLSSKTLNFGRVGTQDQNQVLRWVSCGLNRAYIPQGLAGGTGPAFLCASQLPA